MNDVQRGNDAVAIGRVEQECDRVVYEYALVKVVPCLERGECINAGVIVYSQEHNFLVARTDLDEDRLLTVAPHVDVVGVRSALEAVEAMCRGGKIGRAHV